jgi:hypothetical protein
MQQRHEHAHSKARAEGHWEPPDGKVASERWDRVHVDGQSFVKEINPIRRNPRCEDVTPAPACAARQKPARLREQIRRLTL